MLSFKKIAFSFTGFAALTSAILSWNVFQFLTREPVLPLLSYSNVNFPDNAFNLLQVNCNGTIPYIFCGYDAFLFTGMLVIAVIAGIFGAYTLTSKKRKKSIFGYILYPALAVLASLIMMLIGTLAVGGTLLYKADNLIDNTKLELASPTQRIFDTREMVKQIEKKVPQIYEGYDAFTYAAILVDKAPSNNKNYPVYYAVIIPVKVFASDLNLKALKPYTYAPKAQAILVFNYKEETVKQLFQPLAKAMIKETYPQYMKDTDPEIKILKNGEYEKYEKEHLAKLEEQYKQALDQINGEINYAYTFIAENNQILTYFVGTPDYEEASRLVAAYNADANNYIAEMQGVKARIEENYEIFKKSPITPELQSGVFNPPNTIVIRYDNQKEDTDFPVLNGLSVFIHEYLHYYSYNDFNDLDSALNEGMTEYFTVKIMGKYMQNEVPLDAVGYAAETQLIGNLAKKIPRTELEKIYFSQSPTELEKVITTYYPKVDYEAFTSLVTSLFYLPPGDEKVRTEYLNKINTVLATDSARKQLQK